MAIANTDGSIVLETRVDNRGLKKGMSTMKSGASSLAGAFSKMGIAAAAAFSVKALINFGKEASNLATKAEASVQRLIDIYGEASKAVGDFIDANANALGMSRAAADSYASVYGNLFSVWADQETNATLTTHFLNMTAVVASKTGRTVEDVQERVRSGLLGNTEAIEDLGIFVNVKTIEMTDAFQRMANGKSWEQLDAYTQQQIRTFAILEQAIAKYGEEVENTSALSKSRLNASWEDFQATWGQVINRFLVPVLELLNKILVTSTAVAKNLLGISQSTIEQADAIGEAVEKQEELTEALEDTAKAQKKVLARFDEINILSGGEETSVAGGGIPTLSPLFGNAETASNMEKYAERIVRALAPVREVLDKIIGKFKELFSDIGEVFSSKSKQIKESFQALACAAVSFWNIVKPIYKWIGALLNDAFFAIDDIIAHLIDAFSGLSRFLMLVFKGEWEAAWYSIVDVFKSIINIFIEGINVLIGGLNRISLPNWSVLGDAAGQSINIPKIPRLAQGAVIPPNREFLAVLGDQKQGTNIEAPLQTIVDAFNIALEQNGGASGRNTEVVLEIDGREFGRAVVEQGNRENRRIGTRLVVV